MMLPDKLKSWKPYIPKDNIEELDLNPVFVENEAANYWNVLPWDFRSLDSHRKAELVAHYTVKKKVEYYYNNEQFKKIDREYNKQIKSNRKR